MGAPYQGWHRAHIRLDSEGIHRQFFIVDKTLRFAGDRWYAVQRYRQTEPQKGTSRHGLFLTLLSLPPPAEPVSSGIFMLVL
jgi:hypothetical protein